MSNMTKSDRPVMATNAGNSEKVDANVMTF